MKNYFQRMSSAFQLAMAVIPAAALLVGVGNWLAATHEGVVSSFLRLAGDSIIGQLALLFAISLSYGMSKGKDGAAAVAGVVAYFVPITILSPTAVATLKGVEETAVDPAFSQIAGNVFIGILAGVVAAELFNRFHKTKLPMALSFFSGKRLVPIMAAVFMLGVSIILFFIWPPIYNALVWFGTSFMSLGALGAGIFGFLNRLLIPTGLHQALDSVFWFDVAGISDVTKFLAGEGVKGVTGMYLGGFFPIMMFGLPAGAYAIYRNARPERKKEVGSLMLAGAVASFFTGITEPLEFAFMFTAWPLYILHAVFTGLSLAFSAIMHWTAGFAFSAGFVDFILSMSNPIANHPLMLVVQGLAFAALYYLGFNFAIKKFNLMTPGREKLSKEEASSRGEATNKTIDDKYMDQAKSIYTAIGGHDNINIIDNCATRLRLQLKDSSQINTTAIKAAGAIDVRIMDKKSIQIIIGPEVPFVSDNLTELYNEHTAVNDNIELNMK